jgi:hypothetical protein
MDRFTLTLMTSRPDLRRNAARVAVLQGADRSLDDDRDSATHEFWICSSSRRNLAIRVTIPSSSTWICASG